MAIELYKQVLKKDHNNEYSKFSLAVVYQQLGQLNKAKTIYRDLLKRGVKNEDVRFLIALVNVVDLL